MHRTQFFFAFSSLYYGSVVNLALSCILVIMCVLTTDQKQGGKYHGIDPQLYFSYFLFQVFAAVAENWLTKYFV